MRILFAGGGTGGHIHPILGVAEELQGIAIKERMEMEFHYFGAPGPFRRLLEDNGIRVSKILSSKLRRYFDWQNFIDIPIFLPLSFIQALWKVFWLMPDVLFSKGGPSSLPVVLICKFYRIPIIIHDSDSIMGLANRLVIGLANRIALSFNSTVDLLLQKAQKNPEKQARLRRKIALVGNPIRPSLIAGEILEQKTAKKAFGFNPEKPVILVIGGSQGSVKINDFMLEIAGELINPVRNDISNGVKDFQILHQTGIKNFENAKNELSVILKSYSKEERNSYKIVAYFEKDLKDAYSAADVIVSRGSSGSIFENAAFAKPSILIPLPSEVVGDHQIANAYEYAKTGAAIVIEESNLKPNIFMAQLRNLFSEPRNSTNLSLRGEPEKLSQMSEAAKKFAKPEAAKMIAEEILKLGSVR